MFQRTYSALLSGLSGLIAEVECFIGNGLPYFNIVGIPASRAASARERIRSALKSCGHPLPPSRITINIRPASPAASLSAAVFSVLDLPIALSILACQRLIPPVALENSAFLGELSLNGDLKPLHGALPLTHCLLQHSSPIFLPLTNAAEASLANPPALYGLTSLSQAISVICKRTPPPSFASAKPKNAPLPPSFDSVHGQTIAKRALMIAAAGMHNLLLIGPPGCGKTLLARSLPSLLPPLSDSEKIQLTEIYSACHLLPADQSLISSRPFRAPHHSIPSSSLIGGGSIPQPGEITLAHHGVLYLDELPEFSRANLESLRQPLEEHQIILNRLHASFCFPSDFLLISSMNPCPCGHYPNTKQCHCSSSRIEQYFSKISAPLLDRIDLVLTMAPVPFRDLHSSSSLTHSEALCRIQTARQMQAQRFSSKNAYNSRMDPHAIHQACCLSSSLAAFMEQAYEHYRLTLRSYHKILRVSRTLADLDGCEKIEQQHLTEALQYRLNINGMLS